VSGLDERSSGMLELANLFTGFGSLTQQFVLCNLEVIHFLVLEVLCKGLKADLCVDVAA
jgi:hypothetical protein